jgi:predicted Fe-Mo cluster-binding NifX family protein
MKVAVSSTGTDLTSTIDDRFGRCRYFLIVETDDMSVEVIENPNADLSTGAGIQSASLVADKGVSAVITGTCGPKATRVFDETNIELILDQQGVIRDVIGKFKNGQIRPAMRGDAPAAVDTRQPPAGGGFRSAGMAGSGRGSGCRRRGMGAGFGMGGGRGMGRCGEGGRGRR